MGMDRIPNVANCKSCVHYRYLYKNGKNDAPKACHYILDVGHSRGCPPGDGCTRRETAAQWHESKQGAVRLEEISRSSNGGRKTRTVWSREADAQLLQLRAAGTSLKEIALRMGKTESAVASRVSTLRKRGVLESRS